MVRIAVLLTGLVASLGSGACCLFVPCDGTVVVKATPRFADSGVEETCEVQLVPTQERDLLAAEAESEPLEGGEARLHIGPWEDEYSVRLLCAGHAPSEWVEISISSGHTEVDLGVVTLRPDPPARPGD